MSISHWRAIRYDEADHSATIKPADGPEADDGQLTEVRPGIWAAASAAGERWVGLEDGLGGPRLVLEEASSYVIRVPATGSHPNRGGLPGEETPPIHGPTCLGGRVSLRDRQSGRTQPVPATRCRPRCHRAHRAGPDPSEEARRPRRGLRVAGRHNRVEGALAGPDHREPHLAAAHPRTDRSLGDAYD